ncbi:MAG TPA: DUF2185 domain-containing protein [Pirellulaceae bacterium]|nr:DUF2185 domain-containing protein [Pirellulaceae bacterium]
MAKVKKFKLQKDEIKPLAEDHGSCFATDRITVDGAKVGFMYREEPDFEDDSGWRFMSGDESQSYLDNPDNLALYDVNTIANYDPEIIPFLDAPPGCELQRDPKTGQFGEVDSEPDE